MDEKQNFEGPKNGNKTLIFVYMFMFLICGACDLQKCACRCSGRHNLEKHTFDAKSHQDPVVRIMLQLARHWLVFFENHKIDPPMVLRRPGGMRGGAGRRFEEG